MGKERVGTYLLGEGEGGGEGAEPFGAPASHTHRNRTDYLLMYLPCIRP